MEAINFKIQQNEISREVLNYFKHTDKETANLVAAATDYVYMDDLLFEKFYTWFTSKGDDLDDRDSVLLFHLKRFFDKKDNGHQASHNVDMDKIKIDSDNELKRTFSKKLIQLATHNHLNTNKDIGVFLGISTERARVLCSGKHKPTRKTLVEISSKFNVSVEFLIED